MLLRPNIKLDKITDISVDILKKYNITALILDVDNTLSTHHGQVLTDGLEEWLKNMRENNIKLTVLSNSTKKRLDPFAKKIGLDYISLGLKPLPFGYLRALKALGTKRKNTAIVGDQIFTDTLGGNLVGLNTVLLTPIKPETSLRFRFKRRIEKFLIKHLEITNTEV
ncbi:MAG: YqeG family HAD IIIA-type phosphatase [Acutalibacteraceae bacterium]|jgi:HAD superfamily phosphatase (TIGR01668 family)|nr:YqeG family HAD IIIA-type phosphatase [Acutalibacteraceae bacterium]